MAFKMRENTENVMKTESKTEFCLKYKKIIVSVEEKQ